jgi:hypothetical protein
MAGIDIIREARLSQPEDPGLAVKAAVLVTEPFQQFYAAVGARQPWQRLLLGTALASTAVWLIEPKFAFDDKKNPRPWRPLNGKAPNSTLVHWSILPIAFGLFSATVI